MNIGKDLIGIPKWEEYKSIMNDAHRTFNQKPIIWRHQDVVINRYQEDLPASVTDTELLVLLNYNYRRTWPINMTTPSGEDDEQSLQIFMNKEYLRVNGWLDEDGNFNYDQDVDRFIIDGSIYKAFGDTPVSQMQSDDVFITVVVKRVTLATGDER